MHHPAFGESVDLRRELASCIGCPTALRCLRLWCTGVQLSGSAAWLHQVTKLTRLSELGIDEMPEGEAQAFGRTLAKIPLLRSLKLHNCGLNTEMFANMLPPIAAVAHLISIDLHGLWLSKQAASRLVAANLIAHPSMMFLRVELPRRMSDEAQAAMRWTISRVKVSFD